MRKRIGIDFQRYGGVPVGAYIPRAGLSSSLDVCLRVVWRGALRQWLRKAAPAAAIRARRDIYGGQVGVPVGTPILNCRSGCVRMRPHLQRPHHAEIRPYVPRWY
jgi:hypothetical protein